MKKHLAFDDLKIGQVFNFNDGRMSESETWLPFCKIAENKAVLLVIAGKNSKQFVDEKCLGYFVTTDVRMDSTQWEANNGTSKTTH